jgi:hypothetical protein
MTRWLMITMKSIPSRYSGRSGGGLRSGARTLAPLARTRLKRAGGGTTGACPPIGLGDHGSGRTDSLVSSH